MTLCINWKFAKGNVHEASQINFDDRQWENVILPHTWNADDMRPGISTEKAYIGPAWYRCKFQQEIPLKNQSLFLLFEAIANYSEVWVDGNYLGGRNGGFLSFRFDISKALQAGENHIIAVRTDNSPRASSIPPDPIDWERYGGIYRPAHLLLKHDCHFQHKGILIQTPGVNKEKASIAIETRIRSTRIKNNHLVLKHRLLDPDGQEVLIQETPLFSLKNRSIKNSIIIDNIKNPKLWSIENPNLYQVESSLYEGDYLLDQEINNIGFRWFEFDPDKGFALNGQNIKLCGVNLHQDFIGLGNACPERIFDEEVLLLKNAGINYVRTAHYPRPDYVLDLFDRHGILVMEEQPFWHGSLRTRDKEDMIYNSRRLLREMVEHHGNHPCIIIWNTVNEIMLTPVKEEPHPDPAVRKKAHWLQEEEWPFALRVLEAMNDELHQADPYRYTSMVIGASWENNIKAGTTKHADIVCFNGGAVHNMSYGKPAYDICKENDPDWICMMSEGVLNDETCIRGDWDRENIIWESCAKHWSRFYERPWFSGGAMWVFADYSAKGTLRNMAMVDAQRLPYQSYYFFQSQWNADPMVHICCHWDWQDAQEKERRVVIFTNGDAGELFLNGKSLGEKIVDNKKWPFLPHPPLEWKIAYEPGELKIKVNHKGQQIQDVRKTSSKADRIILSTPHPEIAGDGKDIAFVDIKITDNCGNLCYLFNEVFEISISGAAKIAGINQVEIRGGTGRFLIKSTGEKGNIEATVLGKKNLSNIGIVIEAK